MSEIVNIFLPINLSYALGFQKNRLIETVLLSTHNMCFGWEIKKIIFQLHTLSLRPALSMPIFPKISWQRSLKYKILKIYMIVLFCITIQDKGKMCETCAKLQKRRLARAFAANIHMWHSMDEYEGSDQILNL